MSLEDALLVLQTAAELNVVLTAAMVAGPNTSEWTALEAFFADSPEMLSDLPACREQVISNGTWGDSALAAMVPSSAK